MHLATSDKNQVTSVVELVLRDHEPVAVLPAVVRTIRRFAAAPLLVRLKHMMMTHARVSQVERIVEQHCIDVALEELERGHEQPNALTPVILADDQALLVNDVLMHGAKHGSPEIVKWALRASSSVQIDKALKAAVDNGHLAVVQLVYPLATELLSMDSTDDILLESAALLGHLEVFQWIHDNRRNSNARCFLLFALRCAASSGHLEIVKWIHAKDPGMWTHVAMEQAALHGQQHVLEWIYDEHLPVSASFAMRSVAWKGDWQTLAWLHEKYPEEKGDSNTLKPQHPRSHLIPINCLDP